MKLSPLGSLGLVQCPTCFLPLNIRTAQNPYSCLILAALYAVSILQNLTAIFHTSRFHIHQQGGHDSLPHNPYTKNPRGFYKYA